MCFYVSHSTSSSARNSFAIKATHELMTLEQNFRPNDYRPKMFIQPTRGKQPGCRLVVAEEITPPLRNVFKHLCTVRMEALGHTESQDMAALWVFTWLHLQFVPNEGLFLFSSNWWHFPCLNGSVFVSDLGEIIFEQTFGITYRECMSRFVTSEPKHVRMNKKKQVWVFLSAFGASKTF